MLVTSGMKSLAGRRTGINLDKLKQQGHPKGGFFVDKKIAQPILEHILILYESYDMFKKILFLLAVVFSMNTNAKLPTEEVHVVVTGGPATSLGIVARLFEKYSVSKGVNVKLDWRPGADGIIGANYFSSRPANGSTMLLSSVYEVTRDKTYQTFNTNDIAPVGVVHMAPMWIVANPNLPYNNLTELVTALKKNPQVVSWAITNKMFESVVTESVGRMGLDYNDLIATRFNANGPLAITALVGGHLDVGLLVTPIIKPVVDSKRVKLLGVVNKDDYVPSAGVENLETVIGSRPTKHGHVLFLPTGTKRAVQDAWAKHFQEFVEDVEVKRQLTEQFLPVPIGNNRDLAKKIFEEHQTLKREDKQIQLTKRQDQVLSLIQHRGYSNKAIAQSLDISESAVKAHVKEILKKYNVKTRTQLLAFA